VLEASPRFGYTHSDIVASDVGAAELLTVPLGGARLGPDSVLIDDRRTSRIARKGQNVTYTGSGVRVFRWVKI
jgi:hypothetical protein